MIVVRVPASPGRFHRAVWLGGMATLLLACGEERSIPTEPGKKGESGLRPASHLCFLYTFEVDPDTVGIPASGEEPAIVEIRIEVLDAGHSPDCTNFWNGDKDVVIELSPREPFEEDQDAGLPLVDSLPPELFFFRYADPESEPSPPYAPWYLWVYNVTDSGQIVDSLTFRILYQIKRPEMEELQLIEEEPFFLNISDVVGDLWGPDTTFSIVRLPCPNRPWITRAAFRDELRDLWESSNPVTPGQDPSSTTEQGAWIVKTGEDSYELSTIGVHPIPNGCGMSWQEPPPVETVARIHTHPWATGPYSGICGNPPGRTVHMKSSLLSDQEGDIPSAQRLEALYGDFRFDYVNYENGGVREFEPPTVQLGDYPVCLQE